MEREERLQIIEEQFSMHKIWAEYWIAMATTGVAKQRKLFHDFEDTVEFTDEEKIADAMATAERHINLMRSLLDMKDSIS